MKRFKVIFDMGLYNREFIVEAADKEMAIHKADNLYEKQMGHMMFWYGATAKEV